MIEQLFIYGSLRDRQVQQKVFGRTTSGQPDELTGYKKYQVNLGGIVYPIIKPEAKSTVTGELITLSRAELKMIDHYEGSAYQRKKVTLVSGRQAWVYQEMES